MKIRQICTLFLSISLLLVFPNPILAESAQEAVPSEVPEGTAVPGSLDAPGSAEAPAAPGQETDGQAAPGAQEPAAGVLSRPQGYTETEVDFDARLSEYKEADKNNINGNDVMQYIYNSLRDNFGFNHAAACAVLANAYHESGYNYTILGDGGTSYGIFQWHASRWSNLKNWCEANGYDWQNADGQIAYLKEEFSTGYKSVLDYLLNLEDSDTGAFDGAYYMCVHFEKPADTYGQANKRGTAAIQIFGMESLRDGYRDEILQENQDTSMWSLSNY